MEILSQFLMLLRDGANLEILIFVVVAICLVLGATGRGIVAVYKFFRPSLCSHCGKPLKEYDKGLCGVCLEKYDYIKYKLEGN